MWRKLLQRATGIVLAGALWALGARAGWLPPITPANLGLLLAGIALAIGAGALGGRVGGAIGFGRSAGKQIGLPRSECASRGAVFGGRFGIGIAGGAVLLHPGLSGAIATLAGGFAAGLFMGLMGMWLSRADAAYFMGLSRKDAGDPAGARRHLQEYLRLSREDPHRDERLARADQMLRALDGEPTEGGWGTEPEAALPPAGRGTEPEASLPAAGRGTEPEASLPAAGLDTQTRSAGRSSAAHRQ